MQMLYKNVVAIIIPVYNESKIIEKLLCDFYEILLQTKIEHVFLVINDGSIDDTEVVLRKLENKIPTLKIINKKNEGHGPSIMTGYTIAINYEWAFQIDGDYQYDLNTFLTLWNNRKKFNFLIATRSKKYASKVRDLISFFLNHMTKILFGSGLNDINSPYRLIHCDILNKCIKKINPNSFAPNILITAYILKNKIPFFKTSTFFSTIEPKKSKISLQIIIGSIKSFFDLIIFKCKI